MRELALQLLTAYLRTWVGEWGRWDSLEEVPALIKEAAAELGVTLETLRNDYFVELHGETWEEWNS